jgi:hypothetical protein
MTDPDSARTSDAAPASDAVRASAAAAASETARAPSTLQGGSKAKAFLGLCRVSNLPTVWMNVLAGALLAGGAFEAGKVALLAVSMSALYAFGMCLNDLFDRESDVIHQPYRPIPAGRLSVAEARFAAGTLVIAGLAGVTWVGHPGALGGGVVLVALITTYDWFHKRHASSVLLMAACRFMVFALTGWAVAGEIGAWVIAGGALCFSYTLLISVVARAENSRAQPFSVPVIPRMIAGMSLVDGAFLAIVVTPGWLLAGLAAALLTHYGQRYVRGD